MCTKICALCSGYIWNKTEIKLKQNCFVSVLFQFYFICNHCFSCRLNVIMCTKCSATALPVMLLLLLIVYVEVVYCGRNAVAKIQLFTSVLATNNNQFKPVFHRRHTCGKTLVVKYEVSITISVSHKCMILNAKTHLGNTFRASISTKPILSNFMFYWYRWPSIFTVRKRSIMAKEVHHGLFNDL